MEAAIILNSENIKKKVAEPFVVAADGGYTIAKEKGIGVNLVVGDFDSSVQPKDVKVVKLTAVKNKTDGQACLDYLIKNGYKSVAIYGIGGGRLDHQLCNLSLLKRAKDAQINAVGYDNHTLIMYLDIGSYKLNIKKDTEFSLISFSDETIIDKSKGTMYEMNNLKIDLSNLGRGISNVAIDNSISFEIVKGSAFLFINKEPKPKK